MNYYEFTKKELLNSKLLFHGTCEDIEGDLRGGGYDDVLWTAYNPAVAQTYIPQAGFILYISKPEFSLNEYVKPKTPLGNIAEMIGYVPTYVHFDQYNRVDSYSWKGELAKWPKNQDVVTYIETVLGYQTNEHNTYEIKSSIIDNKEVYFPNSYKLKGKLYIISGMENLKIYDYAENREGDLTNLEYNKFGLFKKVRELDYDAIRINDFAQSKEYGNVGHHSIGLFPSGIEKVKYFSIEACNFDWDKDCSEQCTPEFSEWHKALVEEALSKGSTVPQKVLEEYNL